MPEKIRLMGSLILLMLLAVLLRPAHAQEDITHVTDSAFEVSMRPPVAFYHDAHNEKAGLDDCSVCHHTYENGKKQEGSDSVGMECSECHFSKDRGNLIDLINAYHLQCTGCHASRKVGPVMCGECHRRR